MSRTARTEPSESLVLRTAAVWGTFVLAARDLRSGQSLVMGEGQQALYPKPDESAVADLPIRAVGNGWELDARGASGGLLHLRSRLRLRSSRFAAVCCCSTCSIPSSSSPSRSSSRAPKS
jgi:hypothetical protein